MRQAIPAFGNASNNASRSSSYALSLICACVSNNITIHLHDTKLQNDGGRRKTLFKPISDIRRSAIQKCAAYFMRFAHGIAGASPSVLPCKGNSEARIGNAQASRYAPSKQTAKSKHLLRRRRSVRKRGCSTCNRRWILFRGRCAWRGWHFPYRRPEWAYLR